MECVVSGDGFSVGLVCRVLFPPRVWGVCHAGRGAKGVWCVAPSLTLVLGPVVLARRHDDRWGVPAWGGAAASFFEGRPHRGVATAAWQEVGRGASGLVGVSITSVPPLAGQAAA
jgi:hypothetical protein